MGWIKERIISERKKHYRITGGCDWAGLAEDKIIRQILEDFKLMQKNNKNEIKKIIGYSSN